MDNDKTYDYIIYSASLAGVLTAIDLSNKGNSVLLLNFYGFMGGSITESLNCYQLIDEKKLKGLTQGLFNKIKNKKHSILYHSTNEFILNPETVKIVFQEVIENSKVELLFHIVPFYLTQKQDFVEISLSGKEGLIHIKGKTIIDASEEFDLLKLTNAKRNLNALHYNMFLTGLQENGWKKYSHLEKFFKLNDNRYFVSLSLPKPENEFFIENHSQKVINEFEEIVQKFNGRIQLLAPQTQKTYEIDKMKISENVFHIKSKIDNKYSFSELFSECSEI